MDFYCPKCGCLLWEVYSYQDEHDIYHGLSDYVYCPNCKRVLCVKFDSLHRTKNGENENVEE